MFVQSYKRDHLFIYEGLRSAQLKLTDGVGFLNFSEDLNWKDALNLKLGLIHVQETDP